jgi:hypothetical protein
MSKYKKLTFENVKTYALSDRKSKVRSEDFAKILPDDPSFRDFLDSIPKILYGKDFLEFIDLYVAAVRKKSPAVWMIGAHVIKVGLSPLIISGMERGWITHLAMNGACVIHDVEIAIWGSTSEDVAAGIQDGTFGMAEDSTRFINDAVSGGKGKFGYGESVARMLDEKGGRNLNLSLLYNAYKNDIPVTVHSALGTEIIHQHPGVDAQAVGDTSWTDFQIFSNSLAGLNQNSVVLNVGSAVIMPEVFLKALTVVRNLGFQAFGFTTATFDMIRHYRPTVNVVQRPTQQAGKGYYFIGFHEILLPLMFAALGTRLS